MNLQYVVDEAIKETGIVDVEDGTKELNQLKNLIRLHKINSSDYKTALAGLYANGKISLAQFDANKRLYR